MKKINIYLWLFVVICGVCASIINFDGDIVILLKNISIIFSASLLYIYQFIFKKNVNNGLIMLWIIFVFMAHFIGVIIGGYDIIPFYDKVTHTLSGILTAYAAILISKHYKVNNLFFSILFIISFSCFWAVIWEIFEFICNIFFGGDAQKVMETGVDDTMLDMIVAFIGSIITGGIYYIKNVK